MPKRAGIRCRPNPDHLRWRVALDRRPAVHCLCADGQGDRSSFRLDAQVTLPTTVVIATRSLAAAPSFTQRTWNWATLRLAWHNAPGEEGVGDFHDVAEVVGKETTRGIAAGKPLMQDSVRLQILVRRGEVVTV